MDYANVLQQKRRVDIVTICDDKHLSIDHRIIFITARVHPGETPSSYVCHGQLMVV